MNNKTIIIGTRNKDKLKEIKEILSDLQLNILSLYDFPNIPHIVEDGTTLEENAIIKAKKTFEATNIISIAEDTGLEIEYLGDIPGVFSARFAGQGCSYSDNNRKVLELLKDVPYDQRKAKFRCIIAIAFTENKIEVIEGRINGYIGFKECGNTGFGYDPIFVVPEYGKTFAELGPEIKNKISHRAKALEKLKKILLEVFK